MEGCTILEKRVVIPPNEAERRRGVYDYEVEVPPAPMVEKPRSSRAAAATRPHAPATPDSFTRATPEEQGSGVIRRIPSR